MSRTKVNRFGGLSDEVATVLVHQANHGTFDIESECSQLSMGLQDSVWVW